MSVPESEYGYTMDLNEATSMLARTPRTLAALLTGVSAEWLHRNDGEGTWSAYDIVGHLIVVDADNWLPRLHMIVEHGTGKTFDLFDREAMLGWESVPVEVLLHRFDTTRAASLKRLAAFQLQPSDLQRRGRHPDLGEISAEQLLSAWVAHDLTHLAQVGEVLARRYRETVGPYRAFMPALDRVAHAE